MNDEATKHNQATYDRIASLYAEQHAGRGRSFPGLMAGFMARLPRGADIADLGCGPAQDAATLAETGYRVTASTAQRECWPSRRGRCPAAWPRPT